LKGKHKIATKNYKGLLKGVVLSKAKMKGDRNRRQLRFTILGLVQKMNT
jgi:hypothetical protein